MVRLTRHDVLQRSYAIPGQTWPTELGWLYDVATRSRRHVEIGTYCGRSLFATACGLPVGATLLAVDNDCHTAEIGKLWVGSVRQASLAAIHAATGIEVRHIAKDSLAAARQCLSEGMRFDTVFIDACHEYAECKADIQAWLPMLAPGGIISGHDYWPAHTGVMDAVNELFDGRFEVVPGTRIWFVRN